MKPLLKEAIGYCNHNVPESMHSYNIQTYCDAYRVAKINSANRNVFWFFAGVVMTIFFCLLAGFNFKAKGQDSVQLKVTYSKRIADTVYYQFKILSTKEIVNSKCCCLTQRKKGDLVMVAKKDLIFE